jgi:hypothetical protein
LSIALSSHKQSSTDWELVLVEVNGILSRLWSNPNTGSTDLGDIEVWFGTGRKGWTVAGATADGVARRSRWDRA